MKLVEKRILDFKMYLDEEDEGIGNELIENGIRENLSVNYIQTILRPDMNVLDIGANIGFYALIEAGRVNHVYAIEPVEYNFILLRKNIELNKCKNISTYRIAIGAENGVGKIYTSNRCNWATIVPESNRTKEYAKLWNRFKKGTEEVPIKTLDNFAEVNGLDNIDLIRMDVEGAEVDIINGGLNTLSNMSVNSYLAIEVHGSCVVDKDKIGKMVDQIRSNGFELTKIMTRKGLLNTVGMAELRKQLMTMGRCPQCYFRKVRS